MSFSQKLLLILTSFFSFLASVNGGEFHAILVGYTLDDSIGLEVLQDIKSMKEEVAKMAKYSGQPLHLNVFQGKNATLDNIYSHLQQLQVGLDDVIFFYQNSHGIHPDWDKKMWPCLFYEEANICIPFESVHDYLRSKNPRLLISIADVCNNIVEGIVNPNSSELAASLSRSKQRKEEINKKTMTDCYEKLFLKFKGSIIASGSQRGQYSFVIKAKESPFTKVFFESLQLNEGGIFTISLLKTFQIAAQGKMKSDWNQILKKATQITEKQAKIVDVEQTPQFIVQTE